jgi:carbamoyl-phosphate synthase large subunit
VKILVEAVGSYTSGYLIKAIQDAGYHCVASDISAYSAGALLADSFIEFPKVSHSNLWQIVEELLVKHHVNVVIPTFDEMLLGWAERQAYFLTKGITVILSPVSTLQVFNDKWSSYQAFLAAQLPAPKASLTEIYQVVKPRIGRGAVGVKFLSEQDQQIYKLPSDYISQVKATGCEYTVDCLFDKQGNMLYCVPRKRLAVKEGKSTGGEVDFRQDIVLAIDKLAQKHLFCGAINVQCFADGDVLNFIEINARFGGGSGLGIAATENWLPILIDHFVLDKPAKTNAVVKNGMRMYRQYIDVYDES